MKPKQLLGLVGVLAVAAVAVWMVQTSDEEPPVTTDRDVVAQPGTTTPGMRAHIDPATGEFVDIPPPAADLDQTPTGEEPERVVKPAPGGGVMINTQDILQHTTVAKVDGSDSVTIECMSTEKVPAYKDAHSDPHEEGRAP
jgi:hypothetical protein